MNFRNLCLLVQVVTGWLFRVMSVVLRILPETSFPVFGCLYVVLRISQSLKSLFAHIA